MYRIGAWNINGFNCAAHPENTIFKCNVINSLGLDVIFLAETFCKNDDVFSIPDYKVIQFNRTTISRRSVRGSGGCAIAISNKLLSNHVILSTHKGRQDGILGVKLKCTDNGAKIGVLSNYLPPDNGFYGKDPESYFLDNSLVFQELTQDCDLVVGGGDLNSRTREELDYIPDVDSNISPRNNPDLDKNQHGNHFIQFLKDNRALILNGRITPEHNNFTFVKHAGRSVPDYLYCSSDHVNYSVSCKVLPVSDVINCYNLPVPHSLPDHSVIVAEFDLFSFLARPVIDFTNNVQPKITKRKNLRKISSEFMCSEEAQILVRNTINRLESSQYNQETIDSIYTDLKAIFTTEMDKLPAVPSSSLKKGKQALRKAAPFWSSELQELWFHRCQREKQYLSLRCDPRSQQQRLLKQQLLNDFKLSQNVFDKRFRQLKRQHSFDSLNKLAELSEKAKSDPAEMWKRLKALSDSKNSHVLFEIIRDDGSISKDKKEVLSKWYSDFSECFKGIKDDPDLVFDEHFLSQITKLKSDFEEMSHEQQEAGSSLDSTLLNNDISYDEVSFAIDKSKLGKAFLFVPNEALKNDQAKLLLHKLFNVCFKFGLSPSDWLKSDLKPLFKGGNKDPRNPLDHRPVCIMSCIAKIYSCVLNRRLQNHLNTNNLLSDSQNGFRAGRSCIDHIFSLVTILRNRKQENKQTFLCFVDFRRAFDSVNHVLLFNILSSQFGIVGKIYSSLLSLYKNPQTRVILTSPTSEDATNYFECPLGVKQGDKLSPTMFSMFVHSLTSQLDNSGLGVRLELPPSPPPPTWPPTPAPHTPPPSPLLTPSSVLVSHLIYADDLVCLAESTKDLQSLLKIVHLWCTKHRLEANLLKTEIMHVRPSLTSRSRFNFRFGQRTIAYCQSYKYLGLTINQFLDFGKMSNSFSDPASRALNAVVCKMIKNKGFPFNVFETLYNSCVTSITDYAHEVIGYHQYSESANIHTKAIRAYLGVGRSANLCGLRHEVGWLEPKSRAQIKMLRFFFRMKNMNNSRLTKKIFLYDQHFTSVNPNFTTWSKEISQLKSQNNLTTAVNNFGPKDVCSLLYDSLLKNDIAMFRRDCLSSAKLRTYNSLFSPNVAHSAVTAYTRHILTFHHRKRLAQLRLGCLPLRVETDRFVRPIVPSDQRFCLQPLCLNTVSSLPDDEKYVEDEFHFLNNCCQYEQLRNVMFSSIDVLGFSDFSDREKFIYLLTARPAVKPVSQFIINALEKRQT